MTFDEALTKTCCKCGAEIDNERLELLPDSRVCCDCAQKQKQPLRHDPNEICAKASSTGRNGFVRND